MKWMEMTVFTSEEGLDAVAARFDLLGIRETMIIEGREGVAAMLHEGEKYWDFADPDDLAAPVPCVRAYLADEGDNRRRYDEIKASFEKLRHEDIGLDLGSLRFEMCIRDDEDWANAWKQNYKPMAIGERLLVCPSWEKAESGERKVLFLDPGMAFGTGSHETTRMCLEALERSVKGGEEMLDLGCGSGILSIAALLLGARRAFAVDVDPITEKIAAENAAMNSVAGERFHIAVGDLLSDETLRAEIAGRKYDVITANIVASVIIALAPFASGVLADGGVFITSGIIAERERETMDAITAAGLEITAVNKDGEWRSIVAVKAR